MSIKGAIIELKALLGDRLSTSKHDLDLHGKSETYFETMPPDAVAYPDTTQDVADIIKVCRTHACPVIGFGVGTSLEAQTSATVGGVTVDFHCMNKVLKIDPENMLAVVQPGITRREINEELRDTGLFFSVDPGANATLGGMAATSASGTTSVRYGTMRDNVIATEVVTGIGEVIRTGTQSRKTSSGYDLTALMVGSEGTLGLMTELTVRLHGQPDASATAVCSFPSAELAIDCVITTIQHGIPAARMEYIDALTTAAVNAYSKTDFPEKPHLLVEFHGSTVAVKEQAEAFKDIAADYDAGEFQWSDKAEDRNSLWTMRHAAYYAILNTRPGCQAISTDLCVPISNLAQAIAETQDDLVTMGMSAPILGHVGDGNFHAILMIDPNDPKERQDCIDVSKRICKRALALGGTITGEHGIGIGKLDLMDQEHGAAWQIMGQIKRVFDPNNIMNPGKVVRLN